MVFSVQQGEHGPLVVYKLQVPQTPAVEKPAAQVPAASHRPRLRSGITRVPQQPATRSAATQPVPPRAPRSLGTVVMPASALPPPQVTPVPATVRPAAAPAEPGPVEPAAAPAPLQPRVLGTVAVSEIEALNAYEPTPPVPSSQLPADQEVFHIVGDSQAGTAMINEETGGSLTLQDVNDAVVWRRDTAERLRQVPFAPRF